MHSEDCKTKRAPLCEVIEVDGALFAYDVNTNEIYSVEPPLAWTIQRLRRIDGNSTLLQIPEPSNAEQAEAARHLARAQREGIFLPLAAELVDDCDQDDYLRAYQDGIPQLILSITESCNLRCRYCPYTIGPRGGRRSHGSAMMTREVAERALDFFFSRNAAVDDPAVCIYGGEPLMNWSLLEHIVNYSKKNFGHRKYQVRLDTNATLLTRDYARFLIEHRVHLQISLDGPDIVHNPWRVDDTGHGSQGKVLAAIGTFLDCGGDPTYLMFNAVLAPPYPLQAVTDYFRDFPPFRSRGIAIQPHVRLDFVSAGGAASGGGHGEGERVGRDLRSAYRSWMAAYLTHRLAGGGVDHAFTGRFDAALAKFHYRDRRPIAGRVCPTASCKPGVRKLHVRADGQFQPCERVSDQCTIGNVVDGFDFERIAHWRRGVVTAVRDRCANCTAIRSCSVCYSHANEDAHNAITVCEEVCEYSRESLRHSLAMYIHLRAHGEDKVSFLDSIKVS